MKRMGAWLAALFLAALAAIGFLTAGDYGLPCDEPAEQAILESNLMEYATRLGDTDAVRWYAERGVQPISTSIERDHGESAYYAFAPLLTYGDASLRTTLWHALTWLWFMAGVIALYCLARSLGLSRPLACAAALVLYLAPRFFAEGHYNNKDVVLLALTLVTLACGARLLRKPGWLTAIGFSLAGALAANTKIVGVFAWGLLGVAWLIRLIARRELTARNVGIGVTAILLFFGFYAALTPALWGDPIGYVRYLINNAAAFTRWTGVVLYKGVLFNPTRGLPLPRSYLPMMILLTTPLPFLLLAVVGQLRAAVLVFRKDDRRPLAIVLTLLWLVPIAFVVLKRPLLYNGWRHFYFVYAAIAGMAALGIGWIADWLRGKSAPRIIGAALLTIVFAVSAAGIATQHPNQYAYYNLLAGNAEASYELDYWDVSTLGALKRLATEPTRSEALPLSVGARDDMSAFGLTHAADVLPPDVPVTVTDDPNAPYLLYNTTYARIYGVAAPEGYHALFAVTSYGNDVCTVYEKDGV